METNLPKALDSTLPRTLINGLTVTVNSIHRSIIEAKEKKGVFDLKSFKVIVAKVCVAHGIKELPNDTLLSVLMDFYLSKYAKLITPQEFELAFKLNLTGDLGSKIEHYQLFSAEFMCNVLNSYMAKRTEANKAHKQANDLQQDALPKHDPSKLLLIEILKDFQSWKEAGNTEFLNAAPKLEALSQMFDVNVTEDEVVIYREKSVPFIIRELQKTKTEKTHKNKFGGVVEINHQIARLKAGRLITERDDALIQAQVRNMLIVDVFIKNESDFTATINYNLKQY